MPRVVHVGWDDCYRVQVLRSAGLDVKEARGLDELLADLQRLDHVDLVVVSEDTDSAPEQAAEAVRRAVACNICQSFFTTDTLSRVRSKVGDPPICRTWHLN